MSVFENFTKKVADTAKAAARKSSDIVEVTKLNMSVGAEENKIQKAYSEIGKLVYEQYTKGERGNDDVTAYCEKIESYEENIKEIKTKVLELKDKKACPECGVQMDIEDGFCSKCGAKQEIFQKSVEEEPITEEPAEIECNTCGRINDIDFFFCPKCGNKLE